MMDRRTVVLAFVLLFVGLALGYGLGVGRAAAGRDAVVAATSIDEFSAFVITRQGNVYIVYTAGTTRRLGNVFEDGE
jgi:hypothetical protein